MKNIIVIYRNGCMPQEEVNLLRSQLEGMGYSVVCSAIRPVGNPDSDIVIRALPVQPINWWHWFLGGAR